MVFFENPSFDDAIIGVSQDNRVIYDYYKMIASAMKEEGWTEEDTIDWIDFNTIRALSYVENAPIIIDYFIEEDL